MTYLLPITAWYRYRPILCDGQCNVPDHESNCLILFMRTYVDGVSITRGSETIGWPVAAIVCWCDRHGQTDRQTAPSVQHRLLHSSSKSTLCLPFTGYLHNVTVNSYIVLVTKKYKNWISGYVTSNNTTLRGFSQRRIIYIFIHVIMYDFRLYIIV